MQTRDTMRTRHLDVRIDLVDAIRDLESAGTDVALRYCAKTDAPHHAIMLKQETMSPAPSPDLMVRIGPLKTNSSGKDRPVDTGS